MKITSFESYDPSIGSTRTYEHFYGFLNANPHMIGVVDSLFEDMTPLMITEGVGNVFYNNGKDKLNKFQSINSMVYEWELKTSYYKRIAFAERPRDTGGEGGTIIVAFQENYLQKYDIAVIDGSRQQIQILSVPRRKSDRWWECEARVISSDRNAKLDVRYCNRGDKVHFLSNAMPELSEEGYTKRQSNIEKHRNWITTFRNDIEYSSLFALTEDSFVTTAKSDSKNGKGSDVRYFAMQKSEKELLDSFQQSRSMGLLLNKSNIDINGKPTIFDPATNRDIIIGDGLIPQIERYCPKHIYNRFTEATFKRALGQLGQRSKNIIGNHYLITCNAKMWNDANDALQDILINTQADGTWLWTKEGGTGSGGYIKVGATFSSYEFGGNVITFKADKALSIEYGDDKGYGVILDITPDKVNKMPSISLFSIKGTQFIYNTIEGVGGRDGRTSGVASTPVAGSRLVVMGYAGIGVMNPYRAFILKEA